MKKLVLLTMVLVAGVASADLAVNWNNANVALSSAGGAPDLSAGTLVQLIWSSTGITTSGADWNVGAGGCLSKCCSGYHE